LEYVNLLPRKAPELDPISPVPSDHSASNAELTYSGASSEDEASQLVTVRKPTFIIKARSAYQYLKEHSSELDEKIDHMAIVILGTIVVGTLAGAGGNFCDSTKGAVLSSLAGVGINRIRKYCGSKACAIAAGTAMAGIFSMGKTYLSFKTALMTAQTIALPIFVRSSKSLFAIAFSTCLTASAYSLTNSFSKAISNNTITVDEVATYAIAGIATGIFAKAIGFGSSIYSMLKNRD
jgi:hypothetical protein